ncbi:MBG domain-containing protein [Solitalea lacus]|uniref:MBG domain-containing protein n=1 Tax=Solitalea lacus TaxID=2911172 RepID=UPI001EDC78B4|nr:MBG domain-containing protein [Solitalea lacus]UKJ06770.1 gliding motility-associated C-terminal domain-containing protein [Solitalea lacus]
MKKLCFKKKINLNLRKTSLLLLIPILSLCSSRLMAQTTLAPGDLSITGFNSALTNRDGFSFVCWVNISSGTVIKFTDDGFNSASHSNTAGNIREMEQTITWTATSNIAAGTIIIIEADGTTPTPTTYSNLGTVSIATGSTMLLGNNGDQIFAFQGSYTTSNSTLGTLSGTMLYGISFQGTGANTTWLSTGTTGTVNSYLPSDLSSANMFLGSNAVAAEYNGPRTGLTIAQYKAAVANIANWTLYTNTSSPNGVTSYSTTPISSAAPAPSITGQPSNSTICAGANTSFGITASNATTYKWQVSTNGGASFSDLSNVAPYSGVLTTILTITGATSAMNAYQYRCIASGSSSPDATSNNATLTVNLITVTPVSQTNVACRGYSTGSATVVASGGTAPYTYSWAPSGGTGATASALAAGTYSVTVTDNIGCQAIKSFTITQPAAVLSTSGTSSKTDVSCNGESNGTATVVASGGTAPYTYSWAPSGGTGATASGLAAGTYTVTVTDINSCQTTRAFTINQPAAISGTSVITHVACNGGATGAINLTPTGGTPPYTFNWGGGIFTEDRTGLTAGSYSVTITDANNCTGTVNVTINQPTALVATAGAQNNVSCNSGSNGSATVNVTGGTTPYIYSWAPSGGTGATASGLAAGTYTVTVTDANSCQTTQSFTITQPNALVASFGAQTNVSCNGGSNGSATVNVTGGTGTYTYLWSPLGGTGATASGLPAGTYTVTVKDANLCQTTHSFTITQPLLLSATTSKTDVLCNGGATGSATVTVSGGTSPYTYLWSPSGGTGATASGLAVGNYSCLITDAKGCTITLNFTINQPAALNATTAQVNATCSTPGQASVTPFGGVGSYSYLWSPGGEITQSVTNLAAGNYSCLITDANGCTVTKNFTITTANTLVASTAQTNVLCNGASTGSATVVPSGVPGPFTYVWSPSGGTANTASNLAAGNYSVLITSSNGCSITKSFTITQPVALLATTGSQTNVSCNGGSNGSATVNVSGGTGTYTYSWAPSGGTGATALGLAAGTYTVTVKDANLCQTTQSFTINQPAALNATPTQTNVSTAGGNDGSATVSVSGGTGTYTYSWSPSGGAGSTASGLTAGTYTCTITDDNSCTLTQTFNILQPAALTGFSAMNKTYGDPSFTITAPTSNSAGSFTYVSSDATVASVSGNSISILKPGVITITATQSANGNYTSASISATLTVSQKDISVTLNNSPLIIKQYDGNTSIVLNASNYQLNGIIGADNVTINGIAQFDNKDAGNSKAVIANNFVLSGTEKDYYNLTTTTATTTGTITPKQVTVTADAKSKVYGDVDPGLTYVATGLINGDALTGSLSRDAGNTVGTYQIKQNTLANANYTLTYTGANLTITPKAVSVTASAQTKVYGDVDPGLTYVATGLINGEVLTGSLSRDAGNTVGTYQINQNTLANANYVLTYTGANLTITPKAVTVTADAKSKVYGDVDPGLTYVATGLINGDALTGNLSRDAGNTVGTYQIKQNTLANANYALTYTSANLAITPKAVTVTADAKAKVYGDADPGLTYVTAGLINGDVLTGSLSRNSGNTVGTYRINQNTLANANYTLTYNGANLIITPKIVTVTANAQTKVYGDVDPGLTYVATGLINGDVLTGSLSRDAGNTVGTYQINQNTLANANYTLTYTGANLTITPKAVTVTASAQSKVYGQADPDLTYQETGLINGDVLTGSLSRTTGNNVGVYAINKGTLSAGNNYSLNFQSADLTITKAVLTITADNKQTCQGTLPNLTVNYNGFKNGDGESNLQTKPTVNTVANSTSVAGNYILTPAGAASNNYTFVYVNGGLTINALPQLSISSNKPQRISKGDFVELKAQGNASVFEWQEAPGIQNGKSTSVLTVRPMQTTTYVVRGYNENGCYTEQTYTVEVVEDFVLKATNVITPNADGRNDKWLVRNIESYPNNLVKIFDKAGRIIYTKTGYLNEWDGSFNGQPLQEGTYYYIIDLGNGSKLYKGYITVVRD